MELVCYWYPARNGNNLMNNKESLNNSTARATILSDTDFMWMASDTLQLLPQMNNILQRTYIHFQFVFFFWWSRLLSILHPLHLLTCECVSVSSCACQYGNVMEFIRFYDSLFLWVFFDRIGSNCFFFCFCDKLCKFHLTFSFNSILNYLYISSFGIKFTS